MDLTLVAVQDVARSALDGGGGAVVDMYWCHVKTIK